MSHPACGSPRTSVINNRSRRVQPCTALSDVRANQIGSMYHSFLVDVIHDDDHPRTALASILIINLIHHHLPVLLVSVERLTPFDGLRIESFLHHTSINLVREWTVDDNWPCKYRLLGQACPRRPLMGYVLEFPLFDRETYNRFCLRTYQTSLFRCSMLVVWAAMIAIGMVFCFLLSASRKIEPGFFSQNENSDNLNAICTSIRVMAKSKVNWDCR